MIDVNGGPAQAQLAASARRLREIVASLRAKADAAERLLDASRSLDTRQTWQGRYPDQVRGTLGLLGGWLVGSATAIRARADFLESVAMDYELTVEELAGATGVSTVGCR